MKQVTVDVVTATLVAMQAHVSIQKVLGGEVMLVGRGCKLLYSDGEFRLRGYAADGSDVARVFKDAAALGDCVH